MGFRSYNLKVRLFILKGYKGPGRFQFSVQASQLNSSSRHNARARNMARKNLLVTGATGYMYVM